MFNRREFVLVGEHVNESLEYKMLIQNIQVKLIQKFILGVILLYTFAYINYKRINY